MDASYLVEPEPGLWLLMIDANIFEPRNGEFAEGEEAAFIDSTWCRLECAVAVQAIFIDWRADVSARAKPPQNLLAFPIIRRWMYLMGKCIRGCAVWRNNSSGRIPAVVRSFGLVRGH